jgi:DNA sulfur modification protein DndD
MRIQKLTLCNIGTFRGVCSFDFTTKPTKPVVLIGGENGAGKTTVLEAIQWSLFGRLVNTPRREKANRGSYSKYLKNLIHRGKKENEDSYVEIKLLLRQSQGDVEAVLRRKIKKGSKCTDELTVLIDSEYLPLPEEQWPNVIDAILPSTLSQLYLFDGEQIESLADPEKSSDFLQTGMHALLGVDLIDQLSADLTTMKRKELSSVPNAKEEQEDDKLKIAVFEKNISDADQERASFFENVAELRTDLDSAEREAVDAEVAFKKSGAELYESHVERETEIKLLESKQNDLENRLREFANGSLPLLFLQPSIQNYVEKGIKQRDAEDQKNVTQALLSGLVELEAWLKEHDCSEQALDLVAEFKTNQSKDFNVENEYSVANPAALRIAENLVLLNGLSNEIESINNTLQQLNQLDDDVSKRQKANELSLSKEDAENARSTYELSIQKLAKAKAAFVATEELYNKSVLAYENATNQFDKYLQEKQLNQLDGTKALRFSDACERAKATLATFRKTVVSENSQRIEERIWCRFKQLLRKQKLGSGVKINPESYTLSVIDSVGEIIPPERLSAGERQLLATAMLWGLADSSSRQLPVIVDTPLGRLDRVHRSNLVSEYFPNASSQVVLLSTDEEIDERWVPILEPSIARMYLIDFDDEQQCSFVKEGYFEMELSNA